MRILRWTLLLVFLAGIHSAAAMERFDLVTTQELEQMMAAREKGEIGFPLVCTLDEGALSRSTFNEIKTPCAIVSCLLDELQAPRIRRKIPKSGLVVIITETGNRDVFAIQYLSRFGYTDLKGLRFGMRGYDNSPLISRRAIYDRLYENSRASEQHIRRVRQLFPDLINSVKIKLQHTVQLMRSVHQADPTHQWGGRDRSVTEDDLQQHGQMILTLKKN